MNEYKCLDHGFVRVVDTMGDDSAVVQAARVSYGAGTKSVSSDAALIDYLLRMWHTSPFEMCEIKLHIKLPLFIARQWVRHRTASISEQSARYSIMTDDFYIPEHLYVQSKTNKQCSGNEIAPNEAELLTILRKQSESAVSTYTQLLDSGVSRETARIVLPLNMYTEWYWKIDVHNLLHFLRLRMAPDAQYEIREYAKIILGILQDWMPLTYSAFMKYRVNAINISEQGMVSIKKAIDVSEFAKHDMNAREYNSLLEYFKEQP